MLSISHALTGAFIASKVHNPILAIPLVLASHYFEDWVLHWDVGTGLSTGTRKKSTAIFLEVFDLLISFALVYAWFQAGKPSLNFDAWMGSFFGLLPDFIEAPRNFLKYNPPILKVFNDFHHGFHHSTPNMLVGLLPQFVVVGLIFFLR